MREHSASRRSASAIRAPGYLAQVYNSALPTCPLPALHRVIRHGWAYELSSAARTACEHEHDHPGHHGPVVEP